MSDQPAGEINFLPGRAALDTPGHVSQGHLFQSELRHGVWYARAECLACGYVTLVTESADRVSGEQAETAAYCGMKHDRYCATAYPVAGPLRELVDSMIRKLDNLIYRLTHRKAD